MTEYQELIEDYSSEAYLAFTPFPESEWGNKEIAEKYLEKYWLPKAEYENIWKPIQDQIFINQNQSLSEIIFAEGYKMIALRGGCLFLDEEDFKKFQDCILQLGEKRFVIIENVYGYKAEEPNKFPFPFRMKYPADISWEELKGGNFISEVLFRCSLNAYFIFGETISWGKYADNDYAATPASLPLDIIGFKEEYAHIFEEKFKTSAEEAREIAQWLPPAYKKYLGLKLHT